MPDGKESGKIFLFQFGFHPTQVCGLEGGQGLEVKAQPGRLAGRISEKTAAVRTLVLGLSENEDQWYLMGKRANTVGAGWSWSSASASC
jgi:hypothetical protein